jgi:hypothetical protein
MYPGRRKFVKQTGGLIGLLLVAGFVRAEEWNRSRSKASSSMT